MPVGRLLAGDHACWFFRTRQEQRDGVTAFVREGVQHGAKVLFLDSALPVPVADALRLADLDPDRLVADGRLVLDPLVRGEAGDGFIDPARQLEFCGELIGQAQAEGRSGLWVTGEGTGALGGSPALAERFLEYERLVERFLATTEDALALCQFDAGAVEGGAADHLRSMHNIELDRAQVRRLDRTALGLSVVPTRAGMAVSGEVDLATWATFSNALRRLVGTAVAGREIVLDLDGLRFIDAHGASLLADTARDLRPSRRLVLNGAPPSLRRIVTILRLDRDGDLAVRTRGGDGIA
jgi:anti-anti-sigma factor